MEISPCRRLRYHPQRHLALDLKVLVAAVDGDVVVEADGVEVAVVAVDGVEEAVVAAAVDGGVAVEEPGEQDSKILEDIEL